MTSDLPGWDDADRQKAPESCFYDPEEPRKELTVTLVVTVNVPESYDEETLATILGTNLLDDPYVRKVSSPQSSLLWPMEGEKGQKRGLLGEVELIANYKAMQRLGEIAGFGIEYSRRMGTYIPKWEDRHGYWNTFGHPQFLHDKRMAHVQEFLREFTSGDITYF